MAMLYTFRISDKGHSTVTEILSGVSDEVETET